MKPSKWLKIKFLQLQILHNNPIIQSYFSITYNDKLYFSTVVDDQLTLQINNDILISLQNNYNQLDKVSLQRWQSHVVVFDHEIILSELKTKSLLRKKYQLKKNQLLTIQIKLCTDKEIIICQTLNKNALQHYLMLQDIKIKDDKFNQKRADYGACYFQIITSSNQFDLPVQNGNCLIHLPQTFQISQFKNNKLYAKSKSYKFQELTQMTEEIQLFSSTNNQSAGKVTFKAHWIIDVTSVQPMDYLLLHSVEFVLYDFDMKFDIPNDFIGSKLKITCNNKMFQFNDELGNTKMIRIKKAVWIVTKTQNDSIQIFIQRNNQLISRVDILVQQIQFYQLLKQKHKLIDINNSMKTIGMIKFNIQKSKGYQNILNEQFWKQCIKKKSNNMSLLIEQLSFYYQEDQRLEIVIKTENQQKKITKLQNINYFQEDPLIYHTPVIVNPKPDEMIYFMVKQQTKKYNQNGTENGSEDFIGIAVLNVNDVKIGKYPYEIDFYKNQEKLGTINCLINKYSPINFIKSIFQPQILPYTKTLDLKLSMTTLTLSPYFFTYKYDNQKQVFCIVEINKLKKVLILQPTFQQLSFIPSTTSDNLNFSVDVDQIIKVKITIMVGDGVNQLIYGSKNLNIKMQELRQKQQIIMKDTEFHNFAQTYVGKCNLNFQIIKETIKRLQKAKSKQKIIFKARNNRSSHTKASNKQKRKSISVLDNLNLEHKNEIKIIKNLLPTRKYVQSEQNNIKNNKKEYNISLDLSKRGTFDSKLDSKYQSHHNTNIKLPKIKQSKSREGFNDLLISMNVRKRTLGGYDYNKKLQQDKLMKDQSYSQRYNNSKDKGIDYQVLKNNSNIDRNFQILFPVKKNMSKEQHIKNQLDKYEQKLKGLKSVLQEISNDIDPIQPTIKEGNNTEEMRQTNHFQYAGNQFI